MDSGLLCEFVYRMAGRESVNSEFELIRYNDNLPARIDIKQGVISTTYHWHKEIELVYVMDGAVTIKINTQDRSLHADEFVLINSVENHRLSAENAQCLILDISYEFAAQFDESLYSSVFKVISGSGAEEELHNLLWQLSRTVNESDLPDLRQYSLITEILHVLFVQCRHETPNAVKESENIQSRHVKLALEYIEQHFREEFTEKSVAELLGIQSVYLSRRFKEATGKSFTDYVLEYRLKRAMDALVDKGMTIEEATKAGGFPSKRTFIAKCKRAYGITPFQLLKQQQSGKAPLMELNFK